MLAREFFRAYVRQVAAEGVYHADPHRGNILLTPDGRLARYLFGIEYGPRSLRYAIVEASDGKIGNPVDALLLYCYHYDPMTGRYGLIIMRVVRLAALATVLALASFILIMVRQERRRAASVSSLQPPARASR
jgi:protein SCO1/2